MNIEDNTVFNKCGLSSIRKWLKAWAGLRLIADILGIGYLGFILLVFLFGPGSDLSDFFTEMSILHLMLLWVLGLIVDLGFTIAFNIGLKKESSSILQVIYNYEKFAIAALTPAIPLTLYTLYAGDPRTGYSIGFIIVGILIFVAEMYVLFAIKSLIIKQHNRKRASIRIICEDDIDS